jgi:hypothetical protein
MNKNRVNPEAFVFYFLGTILFLLSLYAPFFNDRKIPAGKNAKRRPVFPGNYADGNNACTCDRNDEKRCLPEMESALEGTLPLMAALNNSWEVYEF